MDAWYPIAAAWSGESAAQQYKQRHITFKKQLRVVTYCEQPWRTSTESLIRNDGKNPRQDFADTYGSLIAKAQIAHCISSSKSRQPTSDS